MCHESSGAALKETIGIGKGTVTLDDFLKADAIFVVGQNPGTNHPRMLTSLELAKKNGAKIISVNPLPEVGNFRFKNPNPQSFKNPLEAAATFFGEGAQLSDLWLQVKINGDLALFKGLMKELLEAERKSPGNVFDHEFIAQYTAGYDDLLAALEIAQWREILDSSGLDPEPDSRSDRYRAGIQECHLLLGHGSDAAQEFGRDNSRSGELPVCCVEISAGQEPVFVLFAVTAMSRVIGQWASGKNRLRCSSKSWRGGTPSILRRNMGATQ